MRHAHVADEIEAKAYDRRLMRRLLAYLKPYRRQVALAVAMLLLLAPLELAGPYLIKVAIDGYIRPGDAQGLTGLAALFLALSLAVVAVRFVQIYLTHWIGQKAMLDLRLDVFRHVQRLPQAYFDRTPVGTLMTRVGSDVEVLNELLSAGVVTVVGDVAILLGIVTVMLWMNWRLALITFIVMPILYWATMVFRDRVRSAFRVIRQKIAALSAHLQETITGLSVIQLFGREEDNRRRYECINLEYQEAYLKAIFYYAVFFPAVEVIGALAAALILLYGGGRIIAGAMTLGAMVAFIEYTQRFMSPIQDLSEKYNILQSAMAASERIFHLLDTPAQADAPGAAPPPPGRGRIAFEGVRFAYKEGEEILKGISFTVEPGERLAIVGATGAGKTSIISLLSRLYELTEGRILLDGTDIRRIPLDELRRRVGIIPQELFLFSGDVTANVLLAGAGGEEKARRILSEIGALEMFARLPQGLATPLRERASILSTGQKQLLAFARALAYDPGIIVLDEATSSLDPETESAVQGAMDRLLSDRTAVIIAHRLATVRQANRIIVMHRGRVRETGTHQELMRAGGIYHRLYQIQFSLPEAGAAG